MSIKAREADTCFTFFITTYIVQSRQGYFKCSFCKFKFFSYCHMVFQVDVDHSGTLDFDEFFFLYGHRLFQVDVDHSGTLDFDEFIFLYGHRVFQVDVDHSGTLDFDNFFFI